MDIMVIRDKLVEEIMTVLPEWQGYPFFVDEFIPPGFFIGDTVQMEYDIDFSGACRFEFAIRYCVARLDERSAYTRLSQILSNNAGTPYAVFNSNPTLDGVVDSIRPLKVGRTGRYRSGAGDYLGAEQFVEIIAR